MIGSRARSKTTYSLRRICMKRSGVVGSRPPPAWVACHSKASKRVALVGGADRFHQHGQRRARNLFAACASCVARRQVCSVAQVGVTHPKRRRGWVCRQTKASAQGRKHGPAPAGCVVSVPAASQPGSKAALQVFHGLGGRSAGQDAVKPIHQLRLAPVYSLRPSSRRCAR